MYCANNMVLLLGLESKPRYINPFADFAVLNRIFRLSFSSTRLLSARAGPKVLETQIQ